VASQGSVIVVRVNNAREKRGNEMSVKSLLIRNHYGRIKPRAKVIPNPLNGERYVPLASIKGRKFAEFFAGIGLVRLALENEGWNGVFANDFDPAKLEIYSQNFDSKDFHLVDIAKLQADDIPNVTLATASFPCTDLSLAGARQGLAGQESGTLWRFLEILQDMGSRRPSLVLLENVPGFLSSNGGEDIRNTIKTLNELGYRCEILQMNAVNFVPQSRARIFIIGFPMRMREGDAGMSFSEDALFPSDFRSEILIRTIQRNGDLDWGHITKFSKVPARVKLLSDIVENLPEDRPEWWNPYRTKYFLSQMAPSHRRVLDQAMKTLKVNYLTAYRRVRLGICRAEIRADGVAGCLRTPRGGSSRQIVVVAGKGQVRVRYMTPREYGRLQGAPESFKINVAPNKALFGFGDAVCVPVVRWIVRNVINPIETEIGNKRQMSVR
jgi:DNA (cytosine-5)-methyltransferase 1